MPKHSNQLGQLVTTKLSKNRGLNLTFQSSYASTTNIELYAVPKPFRDGLSKELPIFINYHASKTIAGTNIPVGGQEMDIIMSPFPPDTWENIYSVKVTPKTKKDYVGFIAEFTDLLEEAKINILSLQSNPTFSEEPYSFWLVIDVTKFDPLRLIDREISRLPVDLSDEDPYKFETRSQQLKAKLDTVLTSIISVTELRGVRFLYNFSKEMKHTRIAYWNEIIRNQKSIKFKLNEGTGTIPAYVINTLIGLQDNEIQHSIVSSPHQKSFFILRIFENSELMYLDVNNKDEIGSIEKISQAIKNHRGNVLTGTAQIESIGGALCHYYVLVQCTPSESVSILKSLSVINQVPKIIVYNCSKKNREKIYSELRSISKIKIVSNSWIRAYFGQRWRHFLDRHNLSKSSIASQILMAIITSVFKLLVYGTALAFVTLLSKVLVALGGKYLFDLPLMEGIKSWLDWM